MIKRMYDWVGLQVHTSLAVPFLALLSFLESIIFPPVAPVLILYCIENRRKAFLYATITTVFSVAGGVASYYIGFALWETVGHRLVSWVTTPQSFNDLVALYKKYESIAVLIGSFTPVPYKALGLTAGFCTLSLSSFIIYSLIGRSARYYLVALILFFWGSSVKQFIDRWFYQLVVLFLLMMSSGTLVLLVQG